MAEVLAFQLPKKSPRRVRLTDDDVAALRPGERVYDADVRGFWAERGKHTTSFRVQADLPKRARESWKTKRTLTRTVGKYGDLSVRKARAEALRFLGQIKAGVDPSPKTPARSLDGWTLGEAWADYRDDFLMKKQRSPATVAFYEKCHKRLARWHARPLVEIAADPMGLKAEHARVTKASRRRPGDTGKNAADATMNFLSIVYNYATGAWPGMPPWPSRAVVKHGRRSHADRGMGPSDLAAWWLDVQTLESAARREMMLFAVLTGLRSSDLRTARWEHVDEAKRTLHIPCPKGGAKRAFTLPLTAAMLACTRRARLAGSPWLFTSPSGEAFADIRAERLGRWIKTGHDLRHTFVNVARAAGVPEPIVGVLLNHKAATITGSYHDPSSTLDFYRDAMERISAAVLAAVEPDEAKRSLLL